MFILGPQFSPPDMGMKCIANVDDGDILGLYYDTTPGIPSFTSMGTICRPNKSSIPQHDHCIPEMLPNRGMTQFLYTSPFHRFISQAPLKNLAMIKSLLRELSVHRDASSLQRRQKMYPRSVVWKYPCPAAEYPNNIFTDKWLPSILLRK